MPASETKALIKQKYNSQFFPEIVRQNAERILRHTDSAKSKNS